MKKLIFIVLASLLAFAFSPKISLNKKKDPPKEIKRTLNGFSEARANARVMFSFGTTDNVPENTQIWFRREIIQAWSDLLNSGYDKSKGADGIRIYFSRNLPSVDTPIHNNNGIIVMSTYQETKVIDGKDSLIHVDYFEHLDNNALFTLKSINGEITHYNDDSAGALLYASCSNCDPTQTCSIVSNHQISRAKGEGMVQKFHRKIFHNGSINSRAEWLDKGLIEYWIKQMKDDDQKNGIPDDGIRIYFSRGTDNDEDKYKTRFVFVPTRRYTSDKTHIDVINCDNPVDLEGFLFDTNKHKKKSTLLKSSSETTVTDNGELCPTHCQGVTLPQS